ncbi:MAG: sodium/hydrogen exchanger [Thermoleophilia bacterium]|nr:sodium/hydrogen exchanger [Thermoleophilia bacterium]
MTLLSTVVAAATHSPGSIDVLTDVAIVLGTCVAFGLAAQRLGQNVLVGYLLAGVLLGGPSSLGIVDDIDSFSFMGEVGIALLLFTVGLDLPVAKVRKFGTTAVLAGGLQVALTCAATFGACLALGVDGSTAFVVGVAVSLSSTAVVIRLLADRAETDSVHGLVATGILVAQDVIVVLVLILIPLLPGAHAAGGDGGFALQLAVALGKLIGLIALVFVVERVLMRRVFQSLSGARELLAVSSLTVSLGAIGACWALDLSPALGGFVAGIMMADASYASQVRSEIAPIRMGLIAIFFAYVGMLADAGWMLDHAGIIVLVVVAVVIGKAIVTWIAARLSRVPTAAALMTAAALAQLGEFSFAVLTTGQDVGLVEEDTFRLLVSASLVSLLATPWVIAGMGATLQRRSLRAGSHVALAETVVEHATGGHAIVVGVGPSGRAVAAALAGARVPVTVVELNARTETGGDDDDLPVGTRVVFGDAARPEILARAGLLEARILVVTIPDPMAIRTIILQARQLAPDIEIVARGRYNIYVDDLAEAGADEVVDEETVTGLELADVAVRRLAASGAADRRRGRDRRG